MESRKVVSDRRYALRVIRNKVEYLKHEFTEMDELDSYATIVRLLQDIEDKQSKDMETLPIGIRYEGTFYIRNAFDRDNPKTKIEGSAFMREDLVKWKIEKSIADIHNPYAYISDIFKDENLTQKIKKEEAKLVYKEEYGSDA